jgi:hypothetical protein
MGYILVAKVKINYKLHTNSQGIKTYVLIIYIIHVRYVDIVMNYYLRLDVGCDFIYAINKFLVIYVYCNLFIDAIYSHKLALFY